MARQRRESSILNEAQNKLLSLKTIDGKFDFGNSLDVATYGNSIEELKGLLDSYNTLLNQVDEKVNLLQASEKKVREFNSRLLAAVAARYGRDSSQYEKIGGVRTSERKKIRRSADHLST